MKSTLIEYCKKKVWGGVSFSIGIMLSIILATGAVYALTALETANNALSGDKLTLASWQAVTSNVLSNLANIATNTGYISNLNNKFGDMTSNCSTGVNGGITRYNTTIKEMEYCNETR